MENRRSLLTRMKERLRYGLFRQEVLDRLARLGLIVYPYYLVREQAVEEPALDGDAGHVSFAKLGPEHAPLVAGMACRPQDLQRVQARMGRTTCYGVFCGDDLAAYNWAEFTSVSAPLTLRKLFPLGDHGAYLFDMYVARAHRGRRLAPWLRYMTYRQIMADGRDELYSATLAYNESSRRFKERLGAVEIEKRLIIGIRSVLVYDRRLKTLAPQPVPSPRVLRACGRLPRR
jgi:hypothetical protein